MSAIQRIPNKGSTLPTVAVTAASLGLGWWLYRRTRRSAVSRLMAIGEKAGHENERIPGNFAKFLAKHHPDLLALFMGVANWGASDLDIPDPVGSNWAGRPPCNGKHLKDYRCGGLGIPHADSSMLENTHEVWGYQHADAVKGMKYNDIITSRYRDSWLAWAGELIEKKRFIRWQIDDWKRRKWDPAEQTNDTMATRILNSRIRNSVSGTGSRVAGQSYSAQARAYNTSDRRQRQLNNIERAVRLVEAVR